MKIVPICILFLSCRFYAIDNTRERLEIFKLNLDDDSKPKFYFLSVLESRHIVIYNKNVNKNNPFNQYF